MKGSVSAVVLLFCLLAPLATAFTFLHYHKKQVKREVKRRLIAGIDKAELVLLKFTEKEAQTKVEWEHAKEFRYNHEMYDIIESQHKGDTIYYLCWWDNEETRLSKQLQDLLAFALGKDPVQQQNQERLANFFKSLCCGQAPEWHHYCYQTCRIIPVFLFQDSFISGPPPVPPPEVS
jgi:hypothetical protein